MAGKAGSAVAAAWSALRRGRGRRRASGLVFVTGCDSGLGLSLAVRAHELGFSVVAGCLDTRSPGAHRLRGSGQRVVALDVTQQASVRQAVGVVHDLLRGDQSLEFAALVNNAGVMVFGEFDWLTDNQIRLQVEVNILGAFRVTKEFCPLIRKYKARIVNVSSHCSYSALPGLSVYSATKSAISSWNDAIRVEMGKFGVRVISLIPGSFYNQSKIMAQQPKYASEMEAELTPEAQEFYGDYFTRYHNYLKPLSLYASNDIITNNSIYRNFEDALLNYNPAAKYETAPWRYKLYYTLFNIVPTHVRDWLVLKFVCNPPWKIN